MYYSEYFDIDKGYYPEINPSSIKDPENKWQETFPHKTFIELLKATERMLGRASTSDRKGIWIEGSFGTGKSRVAWTLKSLLECPAEALTSYFEEYDDLKAEPDLRDKLLAHKEGKIITAYRYSSGEITSDKKLIMAIYDSVMEALRREGIAYRGIAALRERVADWISTETGKQIFSLLISKTEYRGLGSFAGKTTEDIAAQLRNLKVSADKLMEDIDTLSEKEGITAFNISMDDLTAWLTDIIEVTGIKAIVFVWDEFSSYFKQNKASLDEFQKLVELSADKPFYMMIVTHMSGSLFREGDQAFTILRDRFVRKQIEMPDTIAFKLIRHALKVKETARPLWEVRADSLNKSMKKSRKAVSEAIKVDEAVLCDILPIHPLAALMLKNISTAFASNQRSMFNFIKNSDADGLQAFQWFINNFSPDNNDILTIDYLWNFFYEKGTDEHTSGSGRSNLDTVIATILDTYPGCEKKLTSEQKRVLKTILMMQAISQKLNNQISLLLPNEFNIELAFEGTDLDNGRAVYIAKFELIPMGILYEKPSEDKKPQFAASAVAGDQLQIEQIKKRLREEARTNILVQEHGIDTFLSMTPALRARYTLTPVTVENFVSSVNKAANEDTSYQLCAILCFARDEAERQKMREQIKNAVQNTDKRYDKFIFIDTCDTMLGQERFEDWVNYAANEEYWRLKDSNLSLDMKGKADKLLDQWRQDIREGDFVVYADQATESCGNIELLCKTLDNLVVRRYPLSFDSAKGAEALFNEKFLGSCAKLGILEQFGSVCQQKDMLPIMKGAWQNEDYWKKEPTLPLSLLKKKVDALIQEAFNTDVRIAVGDIFDTLMEEGFMPCNLYAFITGFLLKEYSGEPYRYGIGSSGDTGGTMNAEKLSEFIGEYIKNVNTPIKNYKEKYIEIMTQAQKAFVSFAQEAFDVAEGLSVEQTVVRVRTKLIHLGYPVWAFKELASRELDAYIHTLANIANTKNGESVSSLTETMGGMLLKKKERADELSTLLTKENGGIAIRKFLEHFENGEILRLADEIGIEDAIYDVCRQIGSETPCGCGNRRSARRNSGNCWWIIGLFLPAIVSSKKHPLCFPAFNRGRKRRSLLKPLAPS